MAGYTLQRWQMHDIKRLVSTHFYGGRPASDKGFSGTSDGGGSGIGDRALADALLRRFCHKHDSVAERNIVRPSRRMSIERLTTRLRRVALVRRLSSSSLLHTASSELEVRDGFSSRSLATTARDGGDEDGGGVVVSAGRDGRVGSGGDDGSCCAALPAIGSGADCVMEVVAAVAAAGACRSRSHG